MQQSTPDRPSPWLTVVGWGEGGFAGLSRVARQAIAAAPLIIGGPRHLALLPRRLAARGEPWPRPFSVDTVLARRGQPVCVLASGDPMLFGVGATLARRLPASEYRILPAPSSLSLAAARMGWPLEDVRVVSLVGRPLGTLNHALHVGERLLILSADGHTPAAVAALLDARGFGASRMTLLAHLDGAQEHRVDCLARDWQANEVAALNVLAIDCRADGRAAASPSGAMGRERQDPAAGAVADAVAAMTGPGIGQGYALSAGLPDDCYRHDGQITKRDVRAMVLGRLGPRPGECLWDVGAGSGSIGIEWMRSDPRCRAIAIEADASRQALIQHNSHALGVPSLRLVAGAAPAALADLPTPQAIFIGGGLTVPGVMETCWDRLAPGGRLVANAVTLQTEAVLLEWHRRHGGALTRIGIAHAAPLGGFDTWRQALPLTLYEVTKPARATTGKRLLLGGTGDALKIARHLRRDDIYSLAGLGTVPEGLDCTVRVGGYGGADGLAAFIRTEGIEQVIDATHPYAATISANAAAACQATDTPYWALSRASWQASAGDDWREVQDWTQIQAALIGFKRPLWTLGREPLRHLDAIPDGQRWFIRCLGLDEVAQGVRDVDATDRPAYDIIAARGPFTIEGERALFDRLDIDVVVSKNSGGSATEAKLAVARERGIPVIMLARPRLPHLPRAARTFDDVATLLKNLS